MQSCHSALPLFLAFGSPTAVAHAMLDDDARSRAALAVAPSCWALLGSWVASLVVPLDWEQPWQVWPIPCIYGSACGTVAGLCAGALWACGLPPVPDGGPSTGGKSE